MRASSRVWMASSRVLLPSLKNTITSADLPSPDRQLPRTEGSDSARALSFASVAGSVGTGDGTSGMTSTPPSLGTRSVMVLSDTTRSTPWVFFSAVDSRSMRDKRSVENTSLPFLGATPISATRSAPKRLATSLNAVTCASPSGRNARMSSSLRSLESPKPPTAVSRSVSRIRSSGAPKSLEVSR